MAGRFRDHFSALNGRNVIHSEGFGRTVLAVVVGGLVGAAQSYTGLTLVNKVGARPVMCVTVTSALIISLVVDHLDGSAWTLLRSTFGQH
jgi:uncharacterized membrane protein YdcZ (DUF606 family)